jgi:hypothetical protein
MRLGFFSMSVSSVYPNLEIALSRCHGDNDAHNVMKNYQAMRCIDEDLRLKKEEGQVLWEVLSF